MKYKVLAFALYGPNAASHRYRLLYFKEVLYLIDEFNIEMVEKIKPYIVIELPVERFLYKDI